MTKKYLHPDYDVYNGMIQRCTNSNNPNYKYYGARGITVCERWLNSFEAFINDMGKRAEGLTLDRIDNDGNYEPFNCRWATRKEQINNRSLIEKTHCPKGHEYTEQNTRLYKGLKICRICDKERSRLRNKWRHPVSVNGVAFYS